MPEEIEVETKELQETIDEIREDREARSKEAKETEWTRYISLSTAILAVIAALASLQAGKLINDALLAKNQSILFQARASDQWAYYQSAGVKSNAAKQCAELLEALRGKNARVGFWSGEEKRYEAKKQAAESDARAFEQKRDDQDKVSERHLDNHEVFALCVTYTQVAIALSAIAALRKSRLVWYFSLMAGTLGLAMLILGYCRVAKHEAPEGGVEAIRAAGATASRPQQ